MSWHRIRADELRVGDRVSKTRNEEPKVLVGIGAIGPRSRWLVFPGNNRIRPRHETKFWVQVF